MQAIIETLFDAVYLATVTIIGIIMIKKTVMAISNISYLELWR